MVRGVSWWLLAACHRLVELFLTRRPDKRTQGLLTLEVIGIDRPRPAKGVGMAQRGLPKVALLSVRIMLLILLVPMSRPCVTQVQMTEEARRRRGEVEVRDITPILIDAGGGCCVSSSLSVFAWAHHSAWRASSGTPRPRPLPPVPC